MLVRFSLYPAPAVTPGTGIIPKLAERDHTGVAVELPADDSTAGLDRYADVVAEAGRGRGDLVVVAQSLGGFIAPLVCDRLPVRELVLLNAMIPLPGETAGAWWAATSHEMPDDFDVASHFFHDVPDEVRTVGLSGGKEQSDRPFADPWPMAAWPNVATRVIVSTDDRFFPLTSRFALPGSDWASSRKRCRVDIS